VKFGSIIAILVDRELANLKFMIVSRYRFRAF
jgi:hypothetical protein